MRTYSSFCGTVCSDSTGTVTSDAAVRLHRRYHYFVILIFNPSLSASHLTIIANNDFVITEGFNIIILNH